MPRACSVDLLGRGAAPSRKSVAGTLSDTNMVSLYRRLILDYWITGARRVRARPKSRGMC